jgi:hypothetical protein
MNELPLEGINRDGLDYEVVAIEGTDEVEVLLRLQAPGEPGPDGSGFHIQVVLDTSESMHPRKLFPALRGIDYLLNEMQMEDRIGIVTFGGGAKLACPGGMAWEGEEVREGMRQIKPFGLAEPGPGLIMGIRETQRNTIRDKGAIFFISDSQLGSGDHKLAGELAGMAAGAKKAGYTVSTLSMDGRPNPVLKAMAEAGGGKFVATDDGQRVTRLMLERLPSAVGRRIYGVELVLDALGCGTEVSIPGYETEQYDDGVIAQIGDLRNGERREIVFKLKVPGMDDLDDDFVARIELKWSDTEKKKAFWAGMPLKVNGYPADPRPRVRELFNTDPEEGVLFEFEPIDIPAEELETKGPGRRVGSLPGTDTPASPKERAEEARRRRERSRMLAAGELPPELEEKVMEMVREQTSKETARILDEIRTEVPEQILAELRKKVEEGLNDLDEDDDEGEAVE